MPQQVLWISIHPCLQRGKQGQESRASGTRGVESFADVCVFFLSIFPPDEPDKAPHVCGESAENVLAGVTLSNNSLALLYIHQSAVSYLGRLYTRVF